jgi:hypothetical protein
MSKKTKKDADDADHDADQAESSADQAEQKPRAIEGEIDGVQTPDPISDPSQKAKAE